jgi:hypothetical protein
MIVEITAPVINAVEKDSGGDGVGDTFARAKLSWERRKRFSIE